MMRCTKCRFFLFTVVTILLLCFYMHVHEKSERTEAVNHGRTTSTSTPKTVLPSPSYRDETGEQTNHNVHMETVRSVEETIGINISKSLTLQESVQEDMMRCSLSLGISEQAIGRANNDTAIISQKVAEFLKAIWTMIPKPGKFLASYKSPCWHSNIDYSQYRALSHPPNSTNKSALLCLPYFLIPGFCKTGTTTLHTALVNHQEIAAPKMKESHWWARLPMQDKTFTGDKMKSSIARYLAVFIPSSKNIAVHPNYVSYDGSVSSLDSAPYWLHYQDYCIVPALISRVLPSAKIIILMRNPAERTFSNFLFACTQRYGLITARWPLKMKQGLADTFHEQVVLTIHGFKSCLQNYTLFECVQWNFFQSGGLRCGEVGFRLTVSLYYTHIAKWMQFYSREQFLFLKTEDMSSAPHKFLTQITQFLSLSPPSVQQAKLWLQKKVNTQTFVTRQPQSQMKEKTKKLLEEFFRPYNAMLAELVGDDRFLWMD